MPPTTLPAAHQRSPADCPCGIYTTLTTDVNTIYTCPVTPTTKIKPDAYADPLLSAAASTRRYVGTDLYVVAATAEAPPIHQPDPTELWANYGRCTVT